MHWRALVSGTLIAGLPACWHSDGGGASGTGGDAGPEPLPRVILDGGGNVPDPPDGASLCPEGTCNYQTQAGCAADLGCRPTVQGGQVIPTCEPAGPSQDSETCDASSDCGRGLACTEGRCHRLCCGGDWSACSGGQSCYRPYSLVVDDAGGPTGASLCYPSSGCDVLDPNACRAEPNQSCQIVDPRGGVACAPSGTAQAGEGCGPSTPCAPLHLCVNSQDTWQCRRLCRAAEGAPEPSCPPDGGVCVHYNRDPAGVGECTPL
jgi:hypothetical protein